MFGYITINKDELKIKDYKKYQSYYCGVCHSLRNRYGFAGQVTLTYDMTFLAILLTSLYEDNTKPVKHRCVPHPVKSHDAIYNEYTDYAAAMNIMLTYYKMKDNWEDERSVKSNTMALFLKRAYRSASLQYPIQSKAIQEYIEKQRDAENEKDTDIDRVSSITGEMLAALFNMKQDEWQDTLKKMGYFLGKYIYIMDAYEDINKDIKKNNYNPLIAMKDNKNFDKRCEDMLVMVAAESSKAFELLPILDNADILRNILYSGMWNKFNKIQHTER